jgi:hypothetical protein
MAEGPFDDESPRKRPKRGRDLKYNTPYPPVPDYPPDNPDGPAGVREPRRPLPVAGPGAADNPLTIEVSNS